MQEYQTSFNKIKHNHCVFEYHIGHEAVLIKTTEGRSDLVPKKKIKGLCRPNLLKRLLGAGKRHVNVKHGEIEDYIRKHY